MIAQLLFMNLSKWSMIVSTFSLLIVVYNI